MARGSLDHTEEILYRQSKEALTPGYNSPNQAGAFHHKTAWESDDLYTGESKSSSSLSFKIFVFSLLICIFAGAFLFYRLTIKGVTVDSKKITVTLNTDPYVDGGQEEKLSVTVANNNEVSLDEAKLTFVYDKGSSLSSDSEKVTITKDIGQVPVMGVIKEEFPFVLFGQLEERRPLTVRLDYKIKGSNAIFPKETSTEVTLSTPPLSLVIEGGENIVSGEQNEYAFIIKNSTATTSKQALFTLTPPTGFSLLRTSDNPLPKSFTWSIPPLQKGEEKRIKVIGIFTGVVGEKAVLKGIVGSQKGGEETMGDLYSFYNKDIVYAKPGLSTSLTLSTDRGVSTLLRKGDVVTASIHYKNEGASKISYVEYRLLLPSEIDPRLIFVNQNGYYDSATHSVLWSSEALENFLALSSGQEGTLSLNFSLPSDYSATSLPLEVRYQGMDTSLGKVVSSSKDFSYLVSGSTVLNAFTLYKDSGSSNTGPLPPKVDTETSYTAVLTLSSQVDVKNAKVVFSIPTLYVKFLGGVASSSLSVSYDAKTKVVSWLPGDVLGGKQTQAKIKLLLKPSLTQAGNVIPLSSKIVLTGEDSVTKEKIQQVISPFTTEIQDASIGIDEIHVVK